MNTFAHPFAAFWQRYRLFLLLLMLALLLLAFAAVIWYDNALNRGINYTPEPEPVRWADGPRAGVNVYNLHVEPDPAVVTRTLQLARDMGAHYIRMQVPWEDIEIHGRGDFEDRRNVEAVGVVSAWDKYDRIVNTAEALDLELVMRLDRPPDWAREQFVASPFFQEGLQEDANSTGPPDNFEDYGNFVRTVVERYEGQVRFFQIWNEPNLKNEWNWQTPQPEDFVELLRIGATAAREANPDAVILFPSLAPVDGLDKRAPISELEYLDRVYGAGGADYFDIMSAQAYGLGQPPDEHRYVFVPSPRGEEWTWRRPLDTRVDVSRIVLLREIMERHGDSDKAIWVAEFGWNSAPESIPAERRTTWGEPVSEEQKADYLVGYMERARAEWPWMGTMFIWKLRHGGYQEPDPNDPTPYFSLVQRDWTPLPAYTRLQAYLSNPNAAGLGAHSWQHPAVEPLSDGWRIHFTGQRLALIGDLDAEQDTMTTILDGTPITLERTFIDGQRAWRTPRLEDGQHTLEISAPDNVVLASFIVTREPPLPLWLWTALPALLLGMLLLNGAVTMPIVFARAHAVLVRTPPVRLGLRAWLATPGGERALLLGMFAGLLIFYSFTNDLPTRLLGVAVFGLFACVRPDLALLYVPLTMPLFFLPKGIWDERFGLPERGVLLPLHEVVLLTVAGATAFRWLFDHARVQTLPRLHHPRRWNWPLILPPVLLLLAGTVGVLIAAPETRGAALREWRWLLFEPLLFYTLLHYWGRRQSAAPNESSLAAATGGRLRLRMLRFFLAGGAFVGLLGILQFAGLNLVPFIGDKVGFSDDQIFVEGVRRVNSVYGHPNNLGLYMGRIWPLAVVLMLAALVLLPAAVPFTSDHPLRRALQRLIGWIVRFRDVLFFGACCLFAGGGLFVSFSKGALLGAVGALLMLAILLARRSAMGNQNASGTRWLTRLAGALIGLLLVGGPLLLIAAFSTGLSLERLNPLGESSEIRLKLWLSSLAMARDHLLLGVGLDQFLTQYQHYIHPSLIGTNEEFTSHPHNLLLDIWLRLGLTGVVVFGWLLVRFYRFVLPRGELTLLQCGLAAVMTAALLHGLVDNFYFVPDLALAFWLLMWLAE